MQQYQVNEYFQNSRGQQVHLEAFYDGYGYNISSLVISGQQLIPNQHVMATYNTVEQKIILTPLDAHGLQIDGREPIVVDKTNISPDNFQGVARPLLENKHAGNTHVSYSTNNGSVQFLSINDEEILGGLPDDKYKNITAEYNEQNNTIKVKDNVTNRELTQSLGSLTLQMVDNLIQPMQQLAPQRNLINDLEEQLFRLQLAEIENNEENRQKVNYNALQQEDMGNNFTQEEIIEQYRILEQIQRQNQQNRGGGRFY